MIMSDVAVLLIVYSKSFGMCNLWVVCIAKTYSCHKRINDIDDLLNNI